MIDQAAIAVLGVGAVAASQSKRVVARRWAPVIGLLAQPFWFYAAYTAEQWGILATCVLYTGAWAYGLYNQWTNA